MFLGVAKNIRLVFAFLSLAGLRNSGIAILELLCYLSLVRS